MDFALAELGVDVAETPQNDTRNQPTVGQVAAASEVDVEPTPTEGLRQALRGGDVLVGVRAAGKAVVLRMDRGRVRRFIATKEGVAQERINLRTACSDADSHSWMALRKAPTLRAMTSKSEPMSPWQRLRALARIEGKEVQAIFLYAAALGVLSLAAPVAIQALVNTVAFGGVMQPLIVLTLALFVGLSMASALQVLQAYVGEILQRRFMVRVTEDISRKIPQTTKQFQDMRDLTELNNRFFDVITIQKSATELLLTGAGLALQTGLGILLLAFYHPWLMAFSILLLASIVFVTLLGRGGMATARKESVAKFQIGAWLDELARSPELFSHGPGKEFCSEQTAQRAEAYLQARKRHYRHVLPVLLGGVSVQALAVVLVLAFGGYLVMERQLTLGQLVAAEIIVGAIAAGIGKFGRLAEKTFDSAAALDKLGKLFDLPMQTSGFAPLTGNEPMVLRASKLRLGRGGEMLDTAPIDIHLRSGERLWLRGSSGSGLSTLLQTLAGHRPGHSGEVSWDGSIAPDPDHLASQVLYLGEDRLMAGTVLDNLRLVKPSLSQREAWEALRQVGLAQPIERRGGLALHLYSQGAPLAGDDRKRLLLARALIARPRLLLLDNTLDFSEQKLRKSMHELFLGAAAPWSGVVVSRYEDIAPSCTKELALRVDDAMQKSAGDENL